MYLDPWMILLSVIMYGICAWWNRKAGMVHGIETAVNFLLEDKIIKIVNDKIVPYRKK